MRLIMMGTGPFAVPTFLALIASPHDVVALVTRPRAAVRSRGRAPRNLMREAADGHSIQAIDPSNVNSTEAQQQLEELHSDLLVVCDYGQILAAETLAVAPLGGINLHGSLLPKYRGAAPVQWALMNGEEETGTSVIHMTPRLDAGPCLVQRRTKIGPSETAEQLEARLAESGVEAVEAAIEILSNWDRHSLLGSVQENAQATRAPRLKKSDGEVDWNLSAVRIHNQVRALKPWPGTYTSWHRSQGLPVRLILSEVSALAEEPCDVPAGTVAADLGDELRVGTGHGLLAISRLQPAGKREMSVADFLRGHEVTAGSEFGPA